MATEPGKEISKKRRNAFIRYGGLGMQMLLTIGIAGWLGYKLDAWLSLRFPAFLLLFVLAALAATLYKLYRSLSK
ncbi:MAG TPA: AtpZ/AtpI family protein [Cyclobacteriaceae bacterium]|nr:AtpZ/AtpI family protein [Cyclobacteriaceae bacterium]